MMLMKSQQIDRIGNERLKPKCAQCHCMQLFPALIIFKLSQPLSYESQIYRKTNLAPGTWRQQN